MSGKNTGNSGVDSGFPISSLSSCGVEHSVDTTQEDPQSQADAENPDLSFQLSPDVTNSGSPSPANHEQSVTDDADDINSPARSLSLSSLDTSDGNSANRANSQQSVADISTSVPPPDNQGNEDGSVQSSPQPLSETVPSLGHAAAGADAGFISAPPVLGLQSDNERAETLDKQFIDAGFDRNGEWYECNSCRLAINSQDSDIQRIKIWTLHARRSPGCEFLKKTKGPGFIKECRVDLAKKPVTEKKTKPKSESLDMQNAKKIQALHDKFDEFTEEYRADKAAINPTLMGIRAQGGIIATKLDDFAAKNADLAVHAQAQREAILSRQNDTHEMLQAQGDEVQDLRNDVADLEYEQQVRRTNRAESERATAQKFYSLQEDIRGVDTQSTLRTETVNRKVDGVRTKVDVIETRQQASDVNARTNEREFSDQVEALKLRQHADSCKNIEGQQKLFIDLEEYKKETDGRFQDFAGANNTVVTTQPPPPDVQPEPTTPVTSAVDDGSEADAEVTDVQPAPESNPGNR